MIEELTLMKIKQKIFWADYYKEEYKFKNFNLRKHGVTINNEFLSVLANNQFLTAQHLVYFQQLFQYYYGEFLVLSLDCHVFPEFIPDTIKTLTISIHAIFILKFTIQFLIILYILQ